MNKQRVKEQVEIIRQTFGYINQFKNEIFVIKIDSSLINHPVYNILINDLVLLHRMGIRIILVPGTKLRINEILETFHIENRIINGIRIATSESIPFVKMAAFDVCNKVMTLLAENGAYAIIGNWVRARSIGVRDGIDYQCSGTVDKINTDIIRKILEEGMIPIFPNIGWSITGKPYNISASELALSIAKELKAAKLFYLSEYGGISAKEFSLPPSIYVSSEGIISRVTVEEAGSLIDHNISKTPGKALELLARGYEACRSGVKRVHIIDGRVEGILLKEIFSNRGFGTMIYSNQYENIRQMQHKDIPFVLSIMEDAVEDGCLVPRTAAYLEEKINDYFVYEVDGTLHGCGALHSFSNKTAEISSIAVDGSYTNLGIGNKIVAFLIESASKLKMKTVFVLTTQTSDWFDKLGFTEGTLDDLPAERRETYDKSRNSRIMLYKFSAMRLKGQLQAE